jgi:hypothetical protein
MKTMNSSLTKVLLVSVRSHPFWKQVIKKFFLVVGIACVFGWQPLQAADWRIVPSPNTGNQNNLLSGVRAAADDDVWAVGSAFIVNLSQNQTLIEHWNGTRWSVVQSPDTSRLYGNELEAVAVASSDDVWAVGWAATDVTGEFTNTLIEHWNGVAWSIVPSPNLNGAMENILQGVTVVAPNDVWAVGYARVDSQFVLLTLHWDGLVWSVVPALADTNEVILTNVSAMANNDVWAVGVGTDDLTPLAVHWNGRQWTQVRTPITFLPSGLYGVAAISSNNVWVVGADGRNATLNLDWNGTALHHAASPRFSGGAHYGLLAGVAALSSSNVWAVGNIFAHNNLTQTLIEHFDGAKWTIVTSPNVANANTSLVAVTSTPGGTLWAVGDSAVSSGPERTFIVQMTP